jgi:hypothetical protein
MKVGTRRRATRITEKLRADDAEAAVQAALDAAKKAT